MILVSSTMDFVYRTDVRERRDKKMKYKFSKFKPILLYNKLVKLL